MELTENPHMRLTDNPYDAYEEVLMQLADKITPLIFDWRTKGVETPRSPMGISVIYCCRKGLVCNKCMEYMPEPLALINKAVVTVLLELYQNRETNEDFTAIFAFIMCMQIHRLYRQKDPLSMTRTAKAPSLMIAALEATKFDDPAEANMRDHLVHLFTENIDRFEGEMDHDRLL
ncbi:MAG: hypothetical protein MJK15_01835 [Colwellia sp.]|nr:hypothetical protein [Colwellia sp.]